MVNEAAIWIKNNDYHLKYSDREILFGESAWLNDNLMDSTISKSNIFLNKNK